MAVVARISPALVIRHHEDDIGRLLFRHQHCRAKNRGGQGQEKPTRKLVSIDSDHNTGIRTRRRGSGKPPEVSVLNRGHLLENSGKHL